MAVGEGGWRPQHAANRSDVGRGHGRRVIGGGARREGNQNAGVHACPGEGRLRQLDLLGDGFDERE